MSVELLGGRILVDTNVLIYATLRNDTRFEQANIVLERRREEGARLCVSVQNLAEMYPNLTGPKNDPPDSPEVARAKIDSIAGLDRLTVVPVGVNVVRRALRLCERYSVRRQQYFDMQLAATMLEEGIETIVTENSKDFEAVDGIRAINPFL